jgi:ribosomal protein L20
VSAIRLVFPAASHSRGTRSIKSHLKKIGLVLKQKLLSDLSLTETKKYKKIKQSFVF